MKRTSRARTGTRSGSSTPDEVNRQGPRGDLSGSSTLDEVIREGPRGTLVEHPDTPTTQPPSVFTSPCTGWSCIQDYFRRGGLAYIQMMGRVKHGYTLNEHDELNYWRNGPGDEIAFTPLQYELTIRLDSTTLGLTCANWYQSATTITSGTTLPPSSCASPT